MVDIDLDIIKGVKRTVKINGAEYTFKDLSVEEYLLTEHKAAEIETMEVSNVKEIRKVAKTVAEYLMAVIEIKKEEAEKVSFNQYKAFRKYMGRLDLYDQGFNDREIEKMERDVLKKQVKEVTDGQ